MFVVIVFFREVDSEVERQMRKVSSWSNWN